MGEATTDAVAAGADDAAGQHVRAATRVAVADRAHAAVVQPEHRDLHAVEQGGDAPLGQQVVEAADRASTTVTLHRSCGHRLTSGIPMDTGRAGTGWPRSTTNEIDGSGVSGALTNETKRRSFSGSSSTARHSSA